MNRGIQENFAAGAVCNYKTENPPRLMNVLCRSGMLVMCYLLLAFVFCISLSPHLLFAYSIIIGALLSVARARQTPRYHRVLIVF